MKIVTEQIKVEADPGESIEVFALNLVNLYDELKITIEGNFNDTLLYCRKDSTVDSIIQAYYAVRN